MSSNIYTFLTFYILISLSVIGYGQLFFSLNKELKISSNFGYAGLAGILLLCLYSYISSFLYKHGELHNLIILLCGFIYFLYFNYVNFRNNYQNLLILGSLLIIYFIAICIFKTHDDFPYYHFQYSYYLTQTSTVIGIGNFDLGLRTPSSIFYINSLFYFPIVKYFMFHMTVFIIFLYVNIVIIFKIIKDNFHKKYNFLSFYYLLAFIFINVFFYRFSEHGTDRSAQILAFIFIGEILSFINFKRETNKALSKLFLLMALIISLKAFYILYLIFFIVIFFHLIKTQKFTKSIILIITNFYFYLFLFLLIMILFVNFINTGCFLYPVSITCFDHFVWSISKEEVQSLNSWYEQWSKAGANPNFRVENPEIYIQNFNWVGNWISSYFFTKVSDFLLGILLLSLITSATFAPYKKQILNQKKNILFVILLIILLLFEWFYNHPALRYGGYCLIAALVFIFLSILFEKSSLSLEKIQKRFLILSIVSLVIFTGRNINRINNEYKKYGYNPLKNVYFQFNNSHFNIQQSIEKLIADYNNCQSQKKNCSTKKGLNIDLIYGKYVFFRSR